jgi:UDP-N-acetylmuramyl pentapeptide phosphotransferase/UDP-N-acetylglucosamine-1-phosphate transferase
VSVLAAVAACLLSAAALPLVAHRLPYLVGIATTLATVLPVAAALGLDDHRVTAILLAAAAVAALGLIADVGALPLVTRLIVESVAAGGVVMCGVQVTLTGDWLDGPITVMWIVGTTNAFALLDRVKGALPLVVPVTAAFLAGTALVLSEPAIAALLAALTCAFVGFLIRSRGPGAMRLGASGALFAGFVLTCGATALTAGRSTATIAAGLLLPVFVAIVGAAAYGTRRPRRAGLRPDVVALALAGVSAATGTVGLVVALGVIPPGIAAAGAALTAVALVGTLHCPRLRTQVRPAGSGPRSEAGLISRRA